MTSTDDSSLITSTSSCSQIPVDSLDDLVNLSKGEQLRQILDNNEGSDHDEEINDEPQLEDELTPVEPISKTNPIIIEKTANDIHPLLANDISDVFSKVPTSFLSAASYELDDNDSCLSNINLHFFTDYIETETACQWQICNKKPLACVISVHNELYLDSKAFNVRIFQKCPCHPANARKVPFIERLVRDYFEKAQVSMETLKLSRAALNPDLRMKYFLEIIPDKSKRAQYEEMLLHGSDPTLLNELLEYEILDSNDRIVKKLKLLKPPRINSSNTSIHYDLIDKKNLPKLNDGFLVQFCKYIEYRLRNLNSLCVMCGKRTFDSNDKKASKPTICDDYECFSNAMDSKFRNDPLPPSIFSIEIADFLLLLVYAAIHSNRHELILDPYPKLINPYNTSTTLLDRDGDKTQNIEILKTIIDSLMTMGSITRYEAVKISLRSTIELKHPWAFHFFIEHQIADVNTKYQYFIKHEDIVKHVNFKSLRTKHGSIFAFHGSPQENWHSILRSGLQIGKGGYLLNGAAYGAGVYVSPSLSFSASYAQRSRFHHTEPYSFDPKPNDVIHPLDKRNWSCIALCEIIDSPDAYKKHSTDIWTIQDPNLICTRFIFFFPSGVNHLGMRVDEGKETAMIRERIQTLNNIAC